jgi:DNA-binding SARP family transcriptional activator
MSVIEYRILGPLETLADDGPIALGGQKQRALLAVLLLHAGEVVSSEHLVGQLWGEHPPKTAATSLQNLVSQLRKLLGNDAIETRPPGYVLRVNRDRFDLARFEQLVADARHVPAERRAQMLRDALALWRGPPLADFAFEEFAQGEIRRLEELRLDALEARLEAELEAGGGGELVAELEPLVAQFPLRENLRRLLMLALYRAGRQADALRSYHDTRRVLDEELGIEPSPALKQLYSSILRQETVLQREPTRVDQDHHGEVVKAMVAGRLVVVVGGGVNVSDDGNGALPGFAEIAAHLADAFGCYAEQERGLPNVSQYVALMKGVGPLYDELHALFDRDYSPGPVQRCLADLAAALRARSGPGQLILTTNFDQSLERAFTEAGAEFDVVSYIALGRHRGKFLHVSAEGDVEVVELPNTYTRLAPERRTVILKIHGGRRSRFRGRVGQLRRQRGRPHRLPSAGRPRQHCAGRHRREAAAQPLPLPRLSASRLALPCLPTPALGKGGRRLQVMGGRRRARADRARVLARPRRRCLRRFPC